MPTGQLSQCRLEILVYDYDSCSVDECIGYCYLSLVRLEISTNQEQPTVFWAEILPVQTGEVEENSSSCYSGVQFTKQYFMP